MTKDPFNPEREMMTAEEAAEVRADFARRWEDLELNGFFANDGERKYSELMADQLLAPFEVSCPLLAELFRRHGKSQPTIPIL
jgi:hypothetical protein